MISEIKKALQVIHHPGISHDTTMLKLARNALPFILSPSGRSRPPLSVYWSVNSVCNLKCKMCDVGSGVVDTNFYKNLRLDSERQEISIERFRSVVDELAPFRPMIAIVSTEPLLYRYIAEAVEHTVRSGLEINVTTNGYVLPQKAEDLVEAGLTRLTVSLDGPPAIHDAIRGRKGSFERACEGLAKIRELALVKKTYHIETVVNYTITNHNHSCLMEFMKVMDSVPVDRINFVFPHYINEEMAGRHNESFGNAYPVSVSGLGGDTDPSEVDLEVFRSELIAVRREYGHLATVLPELTDDQLEVFFRKGTEFIGRNRCMVSWFVAQIIASGAVVPYTRCFNMELGNINDEPFMNIWNGKKMRSWRKDIRQHGRFPACARCDQIY